MYYNNRIIIFFLSIVFIFLPTCTTVEKTMKAVDKKLEQIKTEKQKHSIKKVRPFGKIAEKKEILSEQTKATSLVKEQQLIVNASLINIRSGPSKDSKIIAQAKKETVLTNIGKENSWYKIRLPNGKIGWVYENLVRE